MEQPKKYDPAEIEDKWYAYWMEQGLFKSQPDEREPFTVVIPPPNVTGVLHMGHMLNNTLQDVLVRRARLLGKNACWVPGTDHASIATEAKVVAKLKAEGVEKSELSRDVFMEHAWEWTHKHGGIILDQLKKLGASCDWDRTNFTMDPHYYESVLKTFVDLHDKGLIYKGVRMVNWDPAAQTALSDEEVVHKEVDSKLYHIQYAVEGESKGLTVATTRPETILGDTAICVHPKDERYLHLHGKKAIVPLIDRPIPIITDEYVDLEFGTGCLKVTPAHDINDYELGIKHGLDSINILNDDGTLNEQGAHFAGKDRFDVRKEIEIELKEKGHLKEVEALVNKVGFSERTDAVIEPKLSTQWFLKMEDLAKPALDRVMDDTIQFHPPKFKNSYRHWMENIKDWCISRQLWWGHRIPAFYYGDAHDDFVVALNAEEAVEKATAKTGRTISVEELRQDEDVLDTWFSSWLWPIAVFDGVNQPDNKELDYYYPTEDLVTAPEIMFFWVARMIIAGYEYKDELPFKNVYYTGIVRDKQGRKMSKSLGNSPDPIELMKKFGADGVRMGMLLCSPAGNDLPFDEAYCEQGRNFSNKIWSAFNLVSSFEVKDIDQPESAVEAIRWMRARMEKVVGELHVDFERYKISEALMRLYKLFWDDFCSWYLEMIKPAYQQPIDTQTLKVSQEIFADLMVLLHPFMPFITEEYWQKLGTRNEGESIMTQSWPTTVGDNHEELLQDFEQAAGVISGIRKVRTSKNIPKKDALELLVKLNTKVNSDLNVVIEKLGNLSAIREVSEKVDAAMSFMVGKNEYFIPMGGAIDVEAELEKLTSDLEHKKGFLKGVEKKLSNERFVSGAPEKVVELEKKKQADALEQIKILEEKIAALS